MPTTVLTLVQDFCEKTGLPRPPALFGSQEKSIRQLRALVQEVAYDLLEYSWEEQRIRKVWGALPGNDQGEIGQVIGEGFQSLVPNTFWAVTRNMPILGPISTAEWQALQVLPASGPEFRYWIGGGRLYVTPGLELAETLSAIYITKYGVLDVDGVTTKLRLTADDDSLLFPDNVVLRGLEYKWRKQKGEAGWEDDYNAYITLIARALGRNALPTLSLDNQGVQEARPGILIPPGSWNV